MKYVNPDSNHSLDIHSEDLAEGQSLDFGAIDYKKDQMKSTDFKTVALLSLTAGVAAYVGSLLARRQFISALRVGDLKVGNLEVDNLKVKNRERTNSSMEESGGVLRFELGSSDVYETGLE